MRMRFFTVLSVSVLFLLAFAPAVFAQTESEDDQESRDDQTERDERNDRDEDADVTCLQVQNAFGNQGQYGNANAQYGDAEGDTVAEVAQELGISQDQVLNCIGIDIENPPSDDDPGDVDDPDDVMQGTAAGKDLPNTGGPPLSAAVFALALLATGAALFGASVRRRP